MISEVNRLSNVNLGEKEHRRWNLTLRWCRRHQSHHCPEGQKYNEEIQGDDRLDQIYFRATQRPSCRDGERGSDERSSLGCESSRGMQGEINPNGQNAENL